MNKGKTTTSSSGHITINGIKLSDLTSDKYIYKPETLSTYDRISKQLDEAKQMAKEIHRTIKELERKLNDKPKKD